MMRSSSHIIEKVIIDVDVSSIELANEIKENSNEWVRDVLSNTLSKYFSKLEEKMGGQIVQLESLDVEIDVDSLEENPMILADELTRKLNDSLIPIVDKVLLDSNTPNYKFNSDLDLKKEVRGEKGNDPLVQNFHQRAIQSFVYFLETGQLPWWITSNSELTEMFEEQSLLTAITKCSKQIAKEFKERASNKLLIQRLVDQFSANVVWTIISSIIEETHSKNMKETQLAKELFQDLIGIEPKIKPQVISFLINSIFARNRVASSNFESTLLHEVWNKCDSIFPASKLSSVQIFQLTSLVSVLSNGKVTEYSTRNEFQQKMASKVASELNLDQLSSLTQHKDGRSLDHTTLTIFEQALRTKGDANKKTSEDSSVKGFPNEIQEEIAAAKDEWDPQKTERDVEEIESYSTNDLVNEFSENEIDILNEENELKSDANVSEQESNFIEEKRIDQEKNVSEKTSNSLEKKETNSDSETAKINSEFEKRDSQKGINKPLDDQSFTSSVTDLESFTVSGKDDHTVISELVSTITPSSTDSNKQHEKLLDEKSFLAENGGLVLINPFLSSLFKNLEFLDEKGALIEKTKAVHILHYLATGNEKVFEHHLTFEKFLCGIPLNETISRDVMLTDEEKEEAEKVLISVCEHWKKLNTSSVDLIRKEFLTRTCKVIRGEGTDRIKVERKAFDILLDSLPWSVSMLKFPWKKELIFVEW